MNTNSQTSVNPLAGYSAKIQDVYIELKDYQFYHSPYSEELDDDRFIGRNAILERIQSILGNSKTQSGAYLVTGFRGMGKTSTVRKAIKLYNQSISEENSKQNEGADSKLPRELKILFRTGRFFATKILTYQHLAYLAFFAILYLFLNKTTEVPPIFSFQEFPLIATIVLWVTTVIWKKQISKAIWLSIQTAGVTLIFTGSLYYFLNPTGFCNNFFCFSLDARWNSIMPGSGWIPLRVLTALLFGYSLVTLLFFFVDLIFIIWNKSIFSLLHSNRQSEINKYESFEINLSQDSLLEQDILKRITKELLSYWKSKKKEFSSPLFERKIYGPWRFVISLVINKQKREFTDYEDVLHKLDLLSRRIVGEVTAESELSISPNLSAGLSAGLARFAVPLGRYASKNQVAYPIASTKEIEDELISIFKRIDDIRKNGGLPIPNFIFVIDELDKIEPHASISLEERESSNPTFDMNINAPGNSHVRQRQEAVARLLSNLKGFLNVVRAKFFFIGGREMYDATLADIADRDSFYSSIFNDVIYVDSFFKDKSNVRAGVTQMTEAFLCQLIMGRWKKEEHEKIVEQKFSLKELSKRIDSPPGKSALILLKEDPEKKIEGPSEFERRKYKLIFLLQNYIIYLNYRSNGTPKKMTTLIEHLVQKAPKNSTEDFFKENLVLLREGTSTKDALGKSLFLRFKFDVQYEIGLTANLYRPYIIVNSRHIKALGDKLLFSSAFIMDHILKFHAFGFSWRNLEMIPEITLVNKEPNLRKFIEELIRFLSTTYIRPTVSGIFQYRFYSRMNRELTYLSKTSDLSAAAFNFTLDESLQIKRHYKRKLLELREKYKGYSPVPDTSHFVHSICFVQTILGDLYFYDKEYDEALLYFTESIQTLRLPSPLDHRIITRHQFYIWLRNKLKLGLTLEKMRGYDSALSYYRTLIIDTTRYLKGIERPKEGEETDTNPSLSADHRSVQMITMPFIAFLGVIEKTRSDGITYYNLRKNEKELTLVVDPNSAPPREEFITKDSFRLHFLFADYFNNVGGILYYKNCSFAKLYEDQKYRLKSLNINLVDQLDKVYSRKFDLSGESKVVFDYQPSLASFTYYWHSLYYLTAYHKERLRKQINARESSIGQQGEISSLLALSAGFLLPECTDMINANRFYYLANVVSKIGDTILASLHKSDFKVPREQLNLFDLLDHEKNPTVYPTAVMKIVRAFYQRETTLKGNLFSVQSILDIYKLAAALYLRGGQVYSYSFQLKKSLYVIKDLVNALKNNVGGKKTLIGFLELNVNKRNPFIKIEEIATNFFKATTWNFDVSNRPQILKYRSILGKDDLGQDRAVIYNNINNSGDNREVILLVESIKIKLASAGFGKALSTAIKTAVFGGTRLNSLLSPYDSINNRYTRILELKYRSEWCYYILKHVLKSSWWLEGSFEKGEVQKDLMQVTSENGSDSNSPPVEDQILTIDSCFSFIQKAETYEGALIFLIKEAIFSLRELIKMINLYEPAYVIGYSYLAEAHRRMGDWSQAYNNLLFHYNSYDSKDKKQSLISKISKLTGENGLVYLEANYHYESAQQNYYRAIQMHSEGRAYKAHVLNLYVLEDDYNDNLSHFNISTERLRVNTGDMRKKINDLKMKTDDSKLYRYESYFFHIEEKKESEVKGNRLKKIDDKTIKNIETILNLKLM